MKIFFLDIFLANIFFTKVFPSVTNRIDNQQTYS